MRRTVAFYVSDHDVADDELDRIGWWWAHADKDGRQESSTGPFDTKEDAIEDADTYAVSFRDNEIERREV